MKRRRFLKSLGAGMLAPMVPLPVSGLGAIAQPVSVSTVPEATMLWAEKLARAHHYCNPGMLQRHLKLDLKAAEALQSQLIKKGVIGAQANAYGAHYAVKPLTNGLAPQNANLVAKSIGKNGDQECKTENERTYEALGGRLSGQEWHGCASYLRWNAAA